MVQTQAPQVRIFADRQQLGQAAAAAIAADLRQVLASQATARLVFAAAPSQTQMLQALALEAGIDWQRVTAFHMDEYLGLPETAPQRFGNWLKENFFRHVPIGTVHLISTDGDPHDRASRYARMLAEAPVDLVCLGIGVNGHLAFNDPHVADLADPEAVKVVELEHTSRQQQVDDGCFDRLDDVPDEAITLTIPRLLSAERLHCVVPGASKSTAVRRSLQEPVSPDCPATALRLHGACTLYLDREAASELN